MVDTGAQVSVIEHSVLKVIQHMTRQVTPITKTQVRPRSVTGESLAVVGRCVLELPGLPRHRFIVCRDLPCPVLLGIDFCRQHRLLIDFDEERIMVDGKWLPAVPMKPKVDRICTINEKGYEDLIDEFREVFGKDGQLGMATGMTMDIETTGPPIRQRGYRVPLVKRQAVRAQVEKLLAQGVIRPSTSPWASPVVMVPKKSGEWRLCVDYRALNNITQKDAFPLPVIRDIFDQLEGASYFSLLDLDSGYHQLKLGKKTIPKTAFTCELGLFEYVRLPFGIATAPAQFQRMMNQVLQGLIGNGCFVYIDDIVIYGKTKQEHDENLRKVLTRLAEYNLRTKPAKCTLGVRALRLLGHIVDKDGVRTDPEKCAAIAKMPRPHTVREVRRFLGASGYYRDLIPGYARLASPLVELTRKATEFEWTPERHASFNALKAALLSDNCIAYPDIRRPYNLYTDACDYAMGAVLTQEDPISGKEKAIYYISHQFSGPQMRWPTIEKEAYAVVFAIEKLRPYVLGCPGITVYTDHKPLTSLFTQMMKNTKIQRWAILLTEFNVNIQYIQGSHNLKADFLSRLRHEPAPDEFNILVINAENNEPYPRAGDAFYQHESLEVLRFDGISIEELKREQHARFRPSMWTDDDYIQIDGVLCSLEPLKRGETERPRILLPEPYRKQVIQKAHEEVGHLSVERTLRRVREAYSWGYMLRDVTNHLKLCAICQACKRDRVRVPMGDGPTPALPDQVIAMDITGPFTWDADHYRWLLVVIDHCTNWVEAYPLRNKTNAGVLAALARHYLPYHATPHVIITDNGTEFKSQEWKNYLKRHAITHQLTTPYWPRANGKVERMNKTIKEMMARLSNNNLTRWVEILPEVIKVLNATTTRATGYPPFLLQTGRDPRLPLSNNLTYREEDFNGERADFLTKALQHSYLQQQDVRAENKRRIDARANAGEVRINDRVMVWAETAGTHTTRWDHGYRVVRVRGNTVWVTHITKGGRRVLHRSKVKVVDPNLVWDEIAERPSRYLIRNAQAGRVQNLPGAPAAVEEPEVQPPLPPALPPRRRGRRLENNPEAQVPEGRYENEELINRQQVRLVEPEVRLRPPGTPVRRPRYLPDPPSPVENITPTLLSRGTRSRPRGLGWGPRGPVQDAQNPDLPRDLDLNIAQNNAAGDVPGTPNKVQPINIPATINITATAQPPQPSPPTASPPTHQYNLRRRDSWMELTDYRS